MGYFDPQKGEGPTISAIAWKTGKKYVRNGQSLFREPGFVEKFVADVKAKKLKPVQRSEAAPQKAEKSPGLTTLVANTFDDIVMDKNKYVIVDYSSPTCKECKELDPIWKEVAKAAKKSLKNVVVAHINVDANDVEEPMEMVPKIVLYPAVSSERKIKAKRIYTGKRRLEEIMTFINDNIGAEEDEE